MMWVQERIEKMNEQKKTRRRRHDVSVANCDKLDACLSLKRKEWIFKTCKMVCQKFFKKGASNEDIEDIASKMYYDMIDRRCADVFPKGVPHHDAEWGAFLKREAEFSYKGYFRKGWRHPTVSLDAPVGNGQSGDDEEDAVTLGDFRADEGRGVYLRRPEVSVEMGLVRGVFAALCQAKGYEWRVRRVLCSLIFEEASVSEVVSMYGLSANNVSVIKSRFMSALRKEGPRLMAAMERCHDRVA